MALIPPDAAIRMRMDLDASLVPITPTQALATNLPDLKPGQRFMAQIQQALPENSYRALVNGKEITLSLPDIVKSGDTMELVVVGRTARALVAQLASEVDGGGSDTTEAVNTTHLSPAGQMISKLLLPSGQTAQPASLNKGQPLLNTPLPAGKDIAAALAPRLEQAATSSGLFYESHQALWLSGQRTTATLLQEPQAQFAPASLAPRTAPGDLGAAAAIPPEAIATEASAAEHHASANLPDTTPHPAANAVVEAHANSLGTEHSVATNLAAYNLGPVDGFPSPARMDSDSAAAPSPLTAKSSAEGIAPTKDLMQSIPAELRPLVQQQLDAAATQRLVWHGEVWPGQTMQWQISRETERQSAGNVEEMPQWNTSLALTTPRLGRIEATLGISGNTVRIRLAADSTESVSKLSDRLPGLKSALETAGLQPTGLLVQDGNA